MNILKSNTKLFDYLTQHYSATHYRFGKIFGKTFPYTKLDLDGITELEIDGIDDLSGIEELKNLKSIKIKGVSDLSQLEKCQNLTSIEADLPEGNTNVDSLINLSKKEGMEKCSFFGRGVHPISSKQAMDFSSTTTLSYDNLSSFTPDQFSKIQTRFDEIHSLIRPEMTEVEKVKTIYKNLLSPKFEYDYSNHSTLSNGYLVNNTMFGPLVEDKGVCSGISSALEHALKNEGFDAVSCGGWANTKPTAGDAHQWNQVKVGGNWYNLDLTNDYDKKSWRFFMKSDNDMDWKECHYADKEDKSEPVHDCTSTKYDELYREDPKERELRELKEQRKQLIETKINSPLSTYDDPAYKECRDRVNSILEKTSSDELLKSEFSVYKDQNNNDRCSYSIMSANKDGQVKTLVSEDFEFSDRFQKGMLEPSVVDFSRRCPIISTNVVSSSDTSKEVIPLNTSNNQPINSNNSELCNVNLVAENNSVMSINNIGQTLATQIQVQSPQITPDVFMSKMSTVNQATMSANQLSISSMGMGGFINFITLFSFGLVIILIIAFIILSIR